MISQTTEYALRAMVWLADQSEGSTGTQQVARATRVPTHYLSKVLQGLRRAGLVKSLAGRTGGFRLARHPAKITVLEVVNAVDPVQRIRKCPMDIKTHAVRLCPLHRRLDRALAMMEEVFSRTRLSELVETSGGNGPLCEPRRRKKAKRRPRHA